MYMIFVDTILNMVVLFVWFLFQLLLKRPSCLFPDCCIFRLVCLDTNSAWYYLWYDLRVCIVFHPTFIALWGSHIFQLAPRGGNSQILFYVTLLLYATPVLCSCQISMAQYKTAVAIMRYNWSYCSLVLNHRSTIYCIEYASDVLQYFMHSLHNNIYICHYIHCCTKGNCLSRIWQQHFQQRL